MRRKYSECVKSVGSYKQAGTVSHMELKKGHEELYRKEPSRHSSHDFPRTATLGLWLDQTWMLHLILIRFIDSLNLIVLNQLVSQHSNLAIVCCLICLRVS